MTDRVKEQLQYFVADKTHRAYRKDIPVSILDICDDDSLRDYEKNAKALARVLRHEEPLVFPFENICGTRVMRELPRWRRTPVNEERFISHLLNEPTIGGISNNVADYGPTITAGLDGRRREIEARRARCETEGDRDGMRFLDNMLFLLDETERFAEKLRTEAYRVGNQAVGELFERIPKQGAKRFVEALQFLKFLNMIVRYDNDTHSCFGRFDQYMYPFFKADLDAGRITETEGLELISEFFISLNRDTDILYCVQQGDNGQSLVLGGVDKHGAPAYNELTALCLQASLDLKIIDPKINLRVSKDTPFEWFLKGAELTRSGLGFPQYLNDDVVIPALVNWGYALEDAREYSLAGCWEFIIPGCCAEVVNIEAMPFLQVLEDTLQAHLETSADFEAFLEKFRQRLFREADAIEARFRNCVVRPSTIQSLLSMQCVEEAEDLSRCARYKNFGIHGPGISNTTDALAAIKKNVFEEKRVTPRELLEALKHNYEGYEDCHRIMKYEAPKMGNDNDYVDALSVRLTDMYADAFEGRKNCFGGIFRPGTGSAMYYIWHSYMGATADGRLQGEPLSANYSPSLNVKLSGPISLFRSFTKQNLGRICNGGPVTLELHDSVFRNAEALEKVAEMVRAYMHLGGHQLQLNAVNSEVLRKAQARPEDYQNLVVRVWGWSGYFVELGPEYQAQIIARAEMVL